MKLHWLLAAAPAVALVFALSCGSSGNGSSFGNDGGGGGDGTFSHGDGPTFGGGPDSMPPQCTGMQCVAQTDNCAGKGMPPTTITGKVYDPAGALSLYNVYVYIPNATPDPITPGNPTCTQCEAPASGQPIIGTSTDATGTFTLAQGPTDTWGVPSGTNIPLVLQVGKWRRQLTIPNVAPCSTTTIPDPPDPAQKLRLPANGSEGDMPLMAFTSGCDPAECFLRHIGISESEFVPPSSTTGHVHFYTGNDNMNGPVASSVSGGDTVAQTYAWWQSSANLLKYDIIFNACECQPFDRGASAYSAMHDYLSGGGRLFTTHFYYNWFAPPTGPADYQGVVQWVPLSCGMTGCQPFPNYFIDTSFPKGKSYADWLQNNGVTQTYAQIALTDTRWDINAVTSEATRWIYNANAAGDSMYATMYMSFNTPVAVPVAQQCGRAVFSDVHLSGSSNDQTFPQECANPDPAYAINEKALEFLFFDLSSCVQDNSKPPPPPPPK